MRMIRAYVQANQPDSPFTESAEIRASVRSEPDGTKRVFMSHKTGDYRYAKVVGQKLLRLGLSVYFVHDDPNVAQGTAINSPVKSGKPYAVALACLSMHRNSWSTKTPHGFALKSGLPRCEGWLRHVTRQQIDQGACCHQLGD